MYIISEGYNYVESCAAAGDVRVSTFASQSNEITIEEGVPKVFEGW